LRAFEQIFKLSSLLQSRLLLLVLSLPFFFSELFLFWKLGLGHLVGVVLWQLEAFENCVFLFGGSFKLASHLLVLSLRHICVVRVVWSVQKIVEELGVLFLLAHVLLKLFEALTLERRSHFLSLVQERVPSVFILLRQ